MSKAVDFVSLLTSKSSLHPTDFLSLSNYGGEPALELMEAKGSQEPAEGQACGGGVAGWAGRGPARSLQLHSCDRHPHHGLPQEG